MNSFMSWIGGKKASRDVIIPRRPLFYERYVEVFGGAGWILFGKPPDNEMEVFNDYNSNVANLFFCVRNHSAELLEWLNYVINSREDFDRIKSIVNQKAIIGDVQRAADFYQLIRFSYASGCDSFGGAPHSIRNDFPLIEQACRRLQRVVVENKDFQKLIEQYKRPVTFFYCDPPYFSTESYYSNVGFTADDHKRLRDTLFDSGAMWLVSYNDCPEIRELYQAENVSFYSYQRLNSIKQRYDGGSMYNELLIANYDMDERAKSLPEQLYFDVD